MTTEPEDEKPTEGRPKKAQTGWYPTTKRWWTIVALALYGAAIVVTLRLLFPVPFEVAIDALAKLTWLGRFISYFVIGALLGHIVWSVSGIRRSFRSALLGKFHRYPPTWFAGVLGAVIYGIYMTWAYWENIRVGATDGDILGIVVSILAFGFGFSADAWVRRCFWTPISPACNHDIDERPISTPVDDKYDMLLVAERLLAAISSSPPKSVVLDGPFGSGKSSVINLLADRLENPKTDEERVSASSINLVTVRGWGLSDENVVTYILEALVRATSMQIDATPISRLPAQYNAIVAKAHSFGEVIASALSVSTTPDKLIQAADDMLEAAGLYVVLAIEDMDRIPSQDIWPSLGALLERFRLARRISHVLAIDGPRVEAVDGAFVNKVSDIRIPMPAIGVQIIREQVIEWLAEQESEEQKGEPTIFPMKSSERIKRLDSRAMDEISDVARIENLRPMQAISSILATPRLLKRVMRTTEWKWKRLRGEVDLLDLFVLTTIFETDDYIYNFILKNINDLQAANLKSTAEYTQFINSRLDSNWNRLEQLGIANTPQYKVLLQILYPNWNGESKTLSPQGMAVVSPDDYAARFLWETLPKKCEEKDQYALRLLAPYLDSAEKTDREPLFKKILTSDKFARKVEQFLNFHDENAFLRFAEDYVDELSNEGWSKLPKDERYRFFGFWSVTWLLRYVTVDDAEYSEFLLPLLEKTAKSNLVLFSDILYVWTFSGERKDSTRRLGPDFFEKAMRILKDAAQMDRNGFSKQLALAPADWLWYIVVSCSSKERLSQGFAKHNWDWLSELMLTAVNDEPDHVIPQIALLISRASNYLEADSRGARRGTRYRLDDPIIKHVFPNSRAALMKILIREIAPTHLTSADLDQFYAIQKLAQRELAQREINRQQSPSN